MSLGLKRGTVQLEPHDKQWDEVAIQTIKILKSILVKKLRIIDIPVIPPSIILFGIKNTSKARAANKMPMVINI